MLRRIAVCLFAVSAATAQSHKSRAQTSTPTQIAVDTTVCEVIAEPVKYNDQRIRVAANIEHDGIHGGVVTDKRCKLGLRFWYSSAAEDHPDLVALDNAIFKEGCIGTTWKRIHAVVSGRFIWRPTDKLGRNAIELDRVEDLEVKLQPGHCDGRGTPSTTPH
jgi:hypothetical protein